MYMYMYGWLFVFYRECILSGYNQPFKGQYCHDQQGMELEH